MPQLKEVFVPGGFPRYTYQNRAKFGVENQVLDSMRRLHKFIAVAGPTKCGKTVLVRKVVGGQPHLSIEGGQIKTADDLWSAVLSYYGMPRASTTTVSQGFENLDSRKVSAGFKPAGMGAEQETAETISKSGSKATAQSKTINLSRDALATLTTNKPILIIDDFHFIPPRVQTELIRALKQPVFDGLTVLLILIPHRMHQAARAEMDVDGRTHTVLIPTWEAGELFKIAEDGFRALNALCPAVTIEHLIQESFSSPHLMQDFCSRLSADNEVWETANGASKLIGFTVSKEDFFQSFASHISPEAMKALRRGPERTNRKDRPMKSGGTCDTYEAVLLALQKTGSMTPLRWAELRRALQEILVEEPQQHEVTRVLEKMDEIAKERKGEPVIDYMKELGELHLVDPFFRFYLKWSPRLLEEPPSTTG